MRGKRVKKLLASVLSAAMILTMLPTGVMAAESVEEAVVEEVQAGRETIGNVVSSSLEYAKTGKVEVFDFGGQQFETYNGSPVNNWLTSKNIKEELFKESEYRDGVKIKNFSVADNNGNAVIKFDATGKTFRLYVAKGDLAGDAITNGKNCMVIDDAYSYGYLGSNSGAADCGLKVYLNKGDVMTAFVIENAGAETFKAVWPDESRTETFEYTNTKKKLDDTIGEKSVACEMKVYADMDGYYFIAPVNAKKINVGRIIIEHPSELTVTGDITKPDTLTQAYKLVFTNQASGAVVETAVAAGANAYEVKLDNGYKYNVKVVDAYGFVISDGKVLDLTSKPESKKADIEIKAVDMVSVSGNIIGIQKGYKHLNDMEIVVNTSADVTYIPEINADIAAQAEDGSIPFKADFERGVSYTISVNGIDDYALTTSVMSATTDITDANISFSAVPTYTVTPQISGMSAAAVAGEKFTFTYLDMSEYGKTQTTDKYATKYVYEQIGLTGLKLRTGKYSVKSSNTALSFAPNFDVTAAGGTVILEYDTTPATSWDFTAGDFKDDIYGVGSEYKGLKLVSNAKANQSKQLYVGSSGKVDVPVSGKCTIEVTAYYCYDFKIGDGASNTSEEKSGAPDKTVSYEYDGPAGFVTITGGTGQSYIKKINVISKTAEVQLETEIMVDKTGANGAYTSINAALEAISKMPRPNKERVVVKIQPGNYEEMMIVDQDNISFVNAAKNPNTALKNGGVDIDDNAVRITWYYGVGYDYYSMGANYLYNSDVFRLNKANGYAQVSNPAGGGTGDMWNAPVTIKGDNFIADGIIFENSFNQYISEAAAKDVIVPQSGAKEGDTKRSELPVGSTKVQQKAYIERAAAIGVANGKSAFFNNCKFIGHQDTLYGGTDTKLAFYDCDIFGGTDYIMGGMTAVFAKCDLVAITENSSATGKNDTFYITAAQQKSGRGYLMYNCTIRSAVPEVEMAETKKSKQGFLGRPWEANTSEVVFYATNIETTPLKYDEATKVVTESNPEVSLIEPIGWNTSLGGKSNNVYEFGTIEKSGEDNTAQRADWAKTSKSLEDAVLADGTKLAPYGKENDAVKVFLGDWDPFVGKDMALTNVEESEYTVTVKCDDNGTATVDKKSYKAGDTAVITVVPNEGYEVDAVKNGEETISANAVGKYEVKVTKDITINVTFKKSTADDPLADAKEELQTAIAYANGEMDALLRCKEDFEDEAVLEAIDAAVKAIEAAIDEAKKSLNETDVEKIKEAATTLINAVDVAEDLVYAAIDAFENEGECEPYVTPVEGTPLTPAQESVATGKEYVNVAGKLDSKSEFKDEKIFMSDEDTTALLVSGKKGKIKTLKVSALEGYSKITVESKAKIVLPGNAQYTIVTDTNGGINKKATSAKSGKISFKKKTSETSFTAKNVKAANAEVTVKSADGKYMIKITIVPVKFTKDIKKAVVTAGDGYIITPVEGTAKNPIKSGIWMVGKNIVKEYNKEVQMDANKKGAKITVKILPTGALQVVKADESLTKGSVKFTYIVNNHKFTTSVKYAAKDASVLKKSKAIAGRTAVGLK